MTDKELRKLSRMELLQMLLTQSREVERLQKKLEQMETALKDRQLMLEDAGSIAEASLRVNRVFETAQTAADQYLSNIKRQYAVTLARCEAMEKETREKCQRLLREAMEQSETE